MTIREFRAKLGYYMAELAMGREIQVGDMILHRAGPCTRSDIVKTTSEQNGLDEPSKPVYTLCQRCKKNPPQRVIEEDGETYNVCESCLRKSFPMSRIKRMPLYKA